MLSGHDLVRLTGVGVYAVGLLLAVAASPAAAETDLFGRDTLFGVVDARLSAADGESSFLDGGFGKTQYSGGGANVAARPTLDLAALVWRPQLGGDLGASVTAQGQSGQTHGIDLAEAYLQYRPVPQSATRFGLRVGLLWPPASLEHDGVGWTTTRTLTPSAINTWISEEVKGVAAEAFVSRDIGGHHLSATAAAFGENDTAGALLTYRGWALDDVRATAFGTSPLPQPRSDSYLRLPDDTRPVVNLDGRLGGYAKLEWRPPAPMALQAFVYDNGADPGALKDGYWGWRTTFADLGLTARPGAGVEVLAQALAGHTYSGPYTSRGWRNDVDFSSAYLLATEVQGRHRFTLRGDAFEVKNNADPVFGERGEHGWSATGDYAYALTPNLSLWVETMHVWSGRSERSSADLLPGQPQNVLQIAVRATL